MNTLNLTHTDVLFLADDLATIICNNHKNSILLSVYPVPRGGVPAAYALQTALYLQAVKVRFVADPNDADIIVDDLVDSGATRQRFTALYPDKPFYALVDKTNLRPSQEKYRLPWLVFPWEGDVTGSVTDNVVRMLQFIGENANRGGLLETPDRVAKAWQFWCSGYTQNAAEILKVFEDGAEGCDQMVTVKDIPIYSHCEHHMAAIFGTVTISYIPNGKIVGLSKLSRLAEMFARRLQVQERLTNQIADALVEHLQPLGVGVVIKARHMCMESRGICQQGHHTVTTALRGVIKDDGRSRSEFMQISH